MFKKNDPLVDSVRAVMEQNARERQIEAAVNEEFGVTSKNALPHEVRVRYEQRLAEAKSCMYNEKTDPSKYSPKQKQLAHLGNRTGHGGDPKKIDKPDLKAVRKVGHIEEEQLDEISKKLAARTAKAAIEDSKKGMGRGEGGPTNSERFHNAKRRALANKAIDKLSGDAKVPANEETQLDEKAVSKAQHRFFGLVRGIQKGKAHGSEKAEKAAKEMSVKSVKDYAKTKEAGLPEKKKKMDEQVVLDEIKKNLEEQLVSVYESGDEAAFADFVSSLSEEQIGILGLNEALPGFMGGTGTGIVSGLKSIGRKIMGTSGTGADPKAAGTGVSTGSSAGERGDYTSKAGGASHLAGGTQAASQTPATPKAPDLSGGRLSTSTGKSVDKPGVTFAGGMKDGKPTGRLEPKIAAGSTFSGKNATAGMAKPAVPATASIGGSRPSGGPSRPALSRPAPKSYGASAAADVGSSLSGSQAFREETKPQIKESFEQFLKNKFLKG